ncbi:MAG: hypothetical protein H0X03_03010, partial [Nitrosopumilus sp.]|nr:hypothetical protein [Nitrosopumilus sp.]
MEIPSHSNHYDCAMEITELKVNDQSWWSVGFDLFGSDKDISFLKHIIEMYLENQIHIKLDTERSFGYPEWISK